MAFNSVLRRHYQPLPFFCLQIFGGKAVMVRQRTGPDLSPQLPQCIEKPLRVAYPRYRSYRTPLEMLRRENVAGNKIAQLGGCQGHGELVFVVNVAQESTIGYDEID